MAGDWSRETEPPLGSPMWLQQQQPVQISGLESPIGETYWAERSCPVPDHGPLAESSETSVKQSPGRDDDDRLSKMQRQIPQEKSESVACTYHGRPHGFKAD